MELALLAKPSRCLRRWLRGDGERHDRPVRDLASGGESPPQRRNVLRWPCFSGVVEVTLIRVLRDFGIAGGRSDSVTFLLDGGINNNLRVMASAEPESGHDRRV